ncbi:MAG: GntR family transcriptional regulator [Desulfuromonas sp.]|nr:MAG: GntR family transcriptional regulator [Desulfuromonas sp.]
MFQPGKIQSLTVHSLEGRGALLTAGNELALLPQREVPEGTVVGDLLEVFVYRDGDLLIATRQMPWAQVGDFALLKVREVNKVGAFLAWGCSKELLVPYAEQTERMRAGRSYLVKICLDEFGRLVGTARIERCLDPDPPSYKEGEVVELLLWRFTELGAAVIVDQRFEALLYRDELRGDFKVGDRVTGRIAKVRQDGKLDVTLRATAAEELDTAMQTVREALRSADGFLPLHDKSSPEEIKRQLVMSKKLFKKALGGLLKRQEVEFVEGGVRLRT